MTGSRIVFKYSHDRFKNRFQRDDSAVDGVAEFKLDRLSHSGRIFEHYRILSTVAMPLLGDDENEDALQPVADSARSSKASVAPKKCAKGKDKDDDQDAAGASDNKLIAFAHSIASPSRGVLASDIAGSKGVVPVIRLSKATVSPESEDDEHPFEHDSSSCELTKCWKCVVGEGFPTWQQSDGSIKCPAGDLITWLIEEPDQLRRLDNRGRPVKSWRCECIFSHNYCNKQLGKGRTSKWARFEVVVKQKSQVAIHAAKCRLHTLAVADHFKMTVQEIPRVGAGRGRKGRDMAISFPPGRPALADWIRAASSVWQLTSPAVFAKRSDEERELQGLPRRRYSIALWTKMLFVFNEILKRRNHKRLSGCRDIALMGDGKSTAESLLFFGVDWSTLEDLEGAFGVFNPYESKGLSDIGATERTLVGMEECISDFCTVGLAKGPHMRHQAGQLQEDVLTHVKSNMSTCWWDGEPKIQKVGRLLPGDFFKASNPFSGRDLMHELDRVVHKAIHEIPELKELKEVWVTGPHSHAKQVTYSDPYKQKFIACQRKYMELSAETVSLDRPLENLCYSGVRKLSEADSFHGIALTPIPSVWCASWYAENGRSKDVKDAALRAVRTWHPQGATTFGMLGDLLLVTQQFKEFSDKTRMDPAVAPRKKKEYCDKLFSMFTKGEILSELGEDGTCTQATIKQIKAGHVFFNGARAIGLSIPPGEIHFSKMHCRLCSEQWNLLRRCWTLSLIHHLSKQALKLSMCTNGCRLWKAKAREVSRNVRSGKWRRHAYWHCMDDCVKQSNGLNVLGPSKSWPKPVRKSTNKSRTKMMILWARFAGSVVFCAWLSATEL